MYDKHEIKQNINEAVQFVMKDTNEENWKYILDLQNRLYEQFDLEE